jgi:hypothetical protein
MRCITPLTALITLGTLTLGACADQATGPAQVRAPRGPTFSVGGAADASGSYLVRFKGNGVPDDFAAAVARLGGEVIFTHPLGIAAVAGLDDARAATLARGSGVAAVDADAFVTLEEPASADVASVEMDVASPTNPTASFFYPRQWNMRAVSAPAAWAAGQFGRRRFAWAFSIPGSTTCTRTFTAVSISRRRGRSCPRRKTRAYRPARISSRT